MIRRQMRSRNALHMIEYFDFAKTCGTSSIELDFILTLLFSGSMVVS